MPHAARVVLLAPFVLAGPLLLLADAVLRLLRLGPVGWPLAAGLLVSVGWLSRCTWRRSLAWWATTKAPVRTVPSPARPRPVSPRHHVRRGH